MSAGFAYKEPQISQMSNVVTSFNALNETELQIIHVRTQAPKQNYEQIDTIRFLTIFLILWQHCLVGWDKIVPQSFLQEALLTFVLQIGRISTVVFFIISGFLLQPKLKNYTLFSYFKERIPKVFGPWFLFVCVFMLINMVYFMPFRALWADRDIKEFFILSYKLLNGVLLHSAYWFITTYMFSMALIVGFKKHVAKIWFGIALCVFTAFYCVNQHYQWIDPNHTKAVLSYSFFIWLGMRIKVNFSKIESFIKGTPWTVVILTFLAVFLVAAFEGHQLSLLHSKDPFATNRFTNILLSIVFFLTLLKVGKISRINKLNPRKTVFGIYLVHSIVILGLMLIIKASFMHQLGVLNIWKLLLFQISFALGILYITYKIVKILAGTRLGWVIGCR